ncbi:carboxypeptidase B1 [Musca vetustissima]|uniref:carboxypeptidase B1 n=1 Tax=Musca vetustissima TaxID=27455 RepID=UPI002AB642A8|nr:carboxypeptidase B1 [Musca vetustissima]
MAMNEKPLEISGQHLSLQSSASQRCLPKLQKTRTSRGRSAALSAAIKGVKSEKRKKSTVAISRLIELPRPDVLNSYLSYSEIVQYLDYLRLRYCEFVKLHTLGLSYERRPIRAIEIHWNSERNLWAQAKENRIASAPSSCNVELKEMELCAPEKGRNMVFIEAGTHAREWITVTVALHCIHQLTEKNGRHRELLRKLRFFIVPVVNPDGYEYSKNKNPRWRKNRRPHDDDGYVGTDCNRNFDIHWDQCKSNAKRNTYPGDKPFSEPETKSLAQMLHKLAPKLLFFLSLHSYAQCIMYPWGHSKCLPQDYKLMESVAMAARNAIKSYNGRYYRVGSISHLTKRIIAGSVVDYAYGVVKIPICLVMELPSTEYGFQPPPEKISPISSESWCGIREMCKHAYNLKTQIQEQETKQRLENQNEGFLPTNIISIKVEPQTKSLLKHKEINDEMMESHSTETIGEDQNDKKILPKFNVRNKIVNRPTDGYYPSLLDE